MNRSTLIPIRVPKSKPQNAPDTLDGFKHALISSIDLPRVLGHIWTLSSDGYAKSTKRIDGKPHTLYLHRLIAGVQAKGWVVDHINADRLDCRRENLRVGTRHQNSMNTSSRKRSRSRWLGVSPVKNGKWGAWINKAGKRCALGVFDDGERAAKVYDAAAIAEFGEWARLNFPGSNRSAPREVEGVAEMVEDGEPPFEEGRRAAGRGVAREENPFNIESGDWRAWLEGWHEGMSGL